MPSKLTEWTFQCKGTSFYLQSSKNFKMFQGYFALSVPIVILSFCRMFDRGITKRLKEKGKIQIKHMFELHDLLTDFKVGNLSDMDLTADWNISERKSPHTLSKWLCCKVCKILPEDHWVFCKTLVVWL